MKISNFIIDDEAHAIELLVTYINKTPDLELVGTATDPVSALPALMGENPPMLLLLDVSMPGMSGLELAGLIHKNTSVVFVTSYREYGVEAFELRAVDFLLKPISYTRFVKAIHNVKDDRSGAKKSIDERTSFFVKGDVKEKYIRVEIGDIQFIRSALNYIEIHLAAEKIITYLTLTEVLEELPVKDFCQVHRSYLVNRKYIYAVENAQVKMINDSYVPLGKAFRTAFQQWLDPQYLISKRLRNR